MYTEGVGWDVGSQHSGGKILAGSQRVVWSLSGGGVGKERGNSMGKVSVKEPGPAW